VDAYEPRSVEQHFEVGERLFLQIGLAAGFHGHVIVLRLDVVDLVDRDHMDVAAIADEYAGNGPLRLTAARHQVRHGFF